MTTLNDLHPGESGIITDIQLSGLMKQRLADLGLTAGAEISMIRSAPFGDPVEFDILGYNLSLRRNAARKIIIVKTSDADG